MKPRVTVGVFIAIGLAVAFALAFFVSPEASSQPDGLNKVAIDNGFAANEKPHSLDGGPTAGYAVKGIDNHRLATGLAGLVGVTVTFAVGAGLFVVVRQTRRSHEVPGQGAT